MISVRWLKWYGLLKSEFPDTSKSLSARSPLGGFSLSIMTPGRLGELGRPLFLPATSRSGAFVLNCVDRSLDFWGLVTFAMVSLFSLALTGERNPGNRRGLRAGRRSCDDGSQLSRRSLRGRHQCRPAYFHCQHRLARSRGGTSRAPELPSTLRQFLTPHAQPFSLGEPLSL